jgi:hypothetical protein
LKSKKIEHKTSRSKPLIVLALAILLFGTGIVFAAENRLIVSNPSDIMVAPPNWLGSSTRCDGSAGVTSSRPSFRTFQITAYPLTESTTQFKKNAGPLNSKIYYPNGTLLNNTTLTGTGPYTNSYTLPDGLSPGRYAIKVDDYPNITGVFSVIQWKCNGCHEKSPNVLPSTFSPSTVHEAHRGTRMEWGNGNVGDPIAHGDDCGDWLGLCYDGCHRGVDLSCVGCHDNPMSGTYGADVHNVTYNKKCEDCHGRLSSIDPSPSCTTSGCHSGQDVTSSLDNSSHSLSATVPCGMCHNTEHDVQVAYDNTQCTDCHNAIGKHAAIECTICHNGTSKTSHTIDFLNTTVAYAESRSGTVNCTICHQGTTADSFLASKGEGDRPKVPTPFNHSNGSKWGSYWYPFDISSNLAALWHFDESANYTVGDSSGNGNNGAYYGDTRLLMNFDDNSSETLADGSLYANTGTFYGNTRLLMHFDEGSGDTAFDSSPYNNNANKGIYEDMDSAPSGTLGGDATYDGTNKWVRLTRASNSLYGYLDYSFNPGESFIAEFEFWTGGGTGADAVALYAYANAPVTSECSGSGYTFAFDEYQDQIQLCYGGSLLTSVSQSGIDDSSWHTAKVIVSGTNIRIYMDGSLKINYNDVSRDKSQIHLGWTARTGGLNNVHRIRNLNVTSPNNNPQWTSGISSSALEFDGVDDHILIPDDTSLKPTQITVSAWVYPAQNTSHATVISKDDYSGKKGYLLHQLNGTDWMFRVYDGTNEYTLSVPNSVDVNTWQHIVGVFNGSSLALYKNGQLIGTPISGSLVHTNLDLKIGARASISGQYFNGTIDEVAIYSKALNATEIQRQYNEQRAMFTDWTAGRSGSALEFNVGKTPEGEGTGDRSAYNHVFIEQDNALNLDDLTISSWINPSRINDSYYHTILSKRENYQLRLDSGNLTYVFYDSAWRTYISNISIEEGRWSHVAVSHDNDSGIIKFYLDGILKSTVATSYHSSIDSRGLTIGAACHWSGCSTIYDTVFIGSIDEVAVYSRVLNSTEIQELYNKGRADHAETWTPGKFGSALEFDGEDDYIQTNTQNILDTTKPFSVSAWIKPNEYKTSDWEIQIVSDRDTLNSFTLYQYDRTVRFGVWNTSEYLFVVVSDDVLETGKWTHAVATYDGTSTIKLYIDGTLNASRSDVIGTLRDNLGYTTMGGGQVSGGVRAFNGTLDEVTIWENKALSADEVAYLYNLGNGVDAERTTSCHFCHGDTKHNASALGRASVTQGSDIVNTTDFTSSTWCGSCHYQGDPEYNATLSQLPVVPPEITNGSWNGISGYYNHSLTSFSDRRCLSCHSGGLSSTMGMDVFMHNVSAGTGGGPDCIACHYMGGPAPAVNLTAFTNSIHGGIDTGDSPYPGSEPCWSCHGNGTQPADHASLTNFTNPWSCPDCHLAGNYSAPVVTRHIPGGLLSTGVSCESCHVKSAGPSEDDTIPGQRLPLRDPHPSQGRQRQFQYNGLYWVSQGVPAGERQVVRHLY